MTSLIKLIRRYAVNYAVLCKALKIVHRSRMLTRFWGLSMRRPPTPFGRGQSRSAFLTVSSSTLVPPCRDKEKKGGIKRNFIETVAIYRQKLLYCCSSIIIILFISARLTLLFTRAFTHEQFTLFSHLTVDK